MDDRTLWQLSDAWIELEAMLDEDDDEAVRNTIELIEGSLQDKVDSICRLIASWTAAEESFNEEIKRLQARKKAFGNRKKRLKDYLKYNLQRLNKPSLETDFYTVRVQQGRESIVIDNIEMIPEKYIKVKKEADKTALKADMEEGREYAGFHVERGDDIVVIK